MTGSHFEKMRQQSEFDVTKSLPQISPELKCAQLLRICESKRVKLGTTHFYIENNIKKEKLLKRAQSNKNWLGISVYWGEEISFEFFWSIVSIGGKRTFYFME